MVELKPFDFQNVQTHFKWNNDEELNFYDSDYPHKIESFESFLQRVKGEIHDNPSTELLEIHSEKKHELIGIIDIHDIDYYNLRCTLECTIGEKRYWNKGYGKHAMAQALSYCFDDLKMNKVITAAFDFNKTWIGLVRKLGFNQEGELREHTFKQDRFHNKLMFGMVKSEYEALKETIFNKKVMIR
ncbi:MAG TPA: GNAT family protein [Balneolales bacterium]|nr:GNAT family protein [Balneolales bacterium]